MDIRASVLFVLYNNFDEAEPTLVSLEEQRDCSDVELIISDDCSKEYDTAQLESLKERLGRNFADVRINVNEENLGSVAHFN
ncbi:MAG: glycosyltransferase, partial [Lachnospiraceae bacterium]|nr:glycosyltransferase [Lachnospiraceae bacterium]